MVPRHNEKNVQRQLGELHRQAVFADVDPATARMHLGQVLEGYETPLDQGRAARDLALREFRAHDPKWVGRLRQSVDLLEDALRDTELGTDDEARVLREQGATNGICGRLVLSIALRSHDSEEYQRATDFFEAAKDELHESARNSLLPDQYEINFAAARVIAERYAHGRLRAIRSLGRAALIAPLSESVFARNIAHLPQKDRWKARRRSIGRIALATRLAIMPDWYAEREAVRHRAAELVA